MLFGEEACLAPFGTAPFGEGCFCAAGSGDVGAAGALCPIDTEMPNSRHCPLIGANDRWKFTWVDTERQKPAICIRPLMRGAGAGGAVGQFARVGASVVDELDERLGCDLVGIDAASGQMTASRGEFNRSLQHILRTSQPVSDRARSFSAFH